MGAVLQVDGGHAQRPTAHIQLRQHRASPANPALAVEVPVVLLRQPHGPRPPDGPAGEHRISVEALGVLPIHQLDELQAVGVVPAEPLRQIPSGVPAAGADAAIIQLIGQHHIQGPDARAVLKKVAQLLQVDAPLHIEHQQAQLLRHLRRGRHRCADLRLRKLGDHGHHRLLRLVVQQRTQALALRIGDTLHSVLPPCVLGAQVERTTSSGWSRSAVGRRSP